MIYAWINNYINRLHSEIDLESKDNYAIPMCLHFIVLTRTEHRSNFTFYAAINTHAFIQTYTGAICTHTYVDHAYVHRYNASGLYSGDAWFEFRLRCRLS